MNEQMIAADTCQRISYCRCRSRHKSGRHDHVSRYAGCRRFQIEPVFAIVPIFDGTRLPVRKAAAVLETLRYWRPT